MYENPERKHQWMQVTCDICITKIMKFPKVATNKLCMETNKLKTFLGTHNLQYKKCMKTKKKKIPLYT